MAGEQPVWCLLPKGQELLPAFPPYFPYPAPSNSAEYSADSVGFNLVLQINVFPYFPVYSSRMKQAAG